MKASLVAPTAAEPGRINLMIQPKPQYQLRGVVLNMTHVVNVKFGSAETLPRKLARRSQIYGRFVGQRLVHFGMAKVEIMENHFFFVMLYLNARLHLFVVAKQRFVLLMIRLLLELIGMRTKINVGEEQRVKRDLIERHVRHWFLPGRLGALGHAVTQRTKGRFVLMDKQLIQQVSHDFSPRRNKQRDVLA